MSTNTKCLIMNMDIGYCSTLLHIGFVHPDLRYYRRSDHLHLQQRIGYNFQMFLGIPWCFPISSRIDHEAQHLKDIGIYYICTTTVWCTTNSETKELLLCLIAGGNAEMISLMMHTKCILHMHYLKRNIFLCSIFNFPL